MNSMPPPETMKVSKPLARRCCSNSMHGSVGNIGPAVFLTDRGFTPFPGTPMQLRALQAPDTLVWGKAIRSAGLVRS
jgi:hypothetical protein